MTTPELDWAQIELEYRAGVLPLGRICSRHGCSLSALVRNAQRNSWERCRTGNVIVLDIGERHVPDSPDYSDPTTPLPSPPAHVENSQWSEFDVIRTRRLTQAAIVEHHSSSIALLRQATDEMMQRLVTYLKIPSQENANRVLSNRESPADLLEKLSRTMVRVIGLERQTYGLDVLIENEDPNGEAAQAKSQTEQTIEKALDQMDELATEIYNKGSAGVG